MNEAQELDFNQAVSLPDGFLEDFFFDFRDQYEEEEDSVRLMQMMLVALFELTPVSPSNGPASKGAMSMQDITSLQHFIFDNLTTTEHLSPSLTLSLIQECRLPNLCELTITVNLGEEGSEGAPDKPDFGQLLRAMPHLTTLAIVSSYGLFYDDSEINLTHESILTTIKQPFTHPSLRSLIIAPELLNKSALKTLCTYALFPELCIFTDDVQSFLEYERINFQFGFFELHQLTADSELITALIKWLETLPHVSLLSTSITGFMPAFPPLFLKLYTKSSALLSHESRLDLQLSSGEDTQTNHSLFAILGSPHLQSVTVIEINGSYGCTSAQTRKLIKMIASNPSLRNVTRLTLKSIELTEDVAKEFGTISHFTNLAHIYFDEVTIATPAALSTLFNSQIVSAVTHLSIIEHRSSLDNNHLLALSTAPNLCNLSSLRLPYQYPTIFDSKGLAHLATSQYLTQLTEIEGLRFGQEDENDFVTFIQSPNLARLKSLFLSQTDLSPRSLFALANAQYLTSLTSLDLSGILLGSTVTTTEEGGTLSFCKVFASNPNFANLTRLQLYQCDITEDDLVDLNTSQYLTNLIDIETNSTAIAVECDGYAVCAPFAVYED